MNTALILIVLILLAAYGPISMVKAAGYLVQRFKFGVPFKELHAYHKEQARLERKEKR